MTQSQALAILESGRSVLLTGAAGTGKTYVLNEFIRRSRAAGKHVAVTATTGLAATHLGGATIHAWSGMGIRDHFDRRALQSMSAKRQELLSKADVLIIDEISMLHDFRLDIIDEILRHVRRGGEPFGGLQVVLCGDFFQLPPVNRKDSRQGGFITGSAVWLEHEFAVCYLMKQYRQQGDSDYTDILNGIRAGQLTRRQLDALQARSSAQEDPFEIPTRLLTVNVDVDSVNMRHLDDLAEDAHTYEMHTSGGKQYVEQLQRSCLAPQTLTLKKGARVMCIKNSPDRRYANGSLGTVVGFDADTDYPTVELMNGNRLVMKPDTWELVDGDRKRASLSQLPLRLAWAITVHKSQGMTLDAARIDLAKAFVEGMGYVALSRVRSLDHLILDGLNGMALRVSPVARQIDAELRRRSSDAEAEYAAVFTKWEADEERHKSEPEPVVGKKSAVAVLNPELYEALKQWRTTLAAEIAKPAYIIASNAALEHLSARVPLNDDELLLVNGFGPKKLETYGADILQITTAFASKKAA